MIRRLEGFWASRENARVGLKGELRPVGSLAREAECWV